MSYVPLEVLIKQCPNLFRLVLAASERANEINEAILASGKTGTERATTLALRDIAAGRLRIILNKKSNKKEE